MLQRVDVGQRSLQAYRGLAPDEQLEELGRLAADLRGARVLHLNATPYGGGVSELLRSAVPILLDLGLSAEWRIISGDAPFFRVTKRIHNALQGARLTLSPDERQSYLQTAESNARLLEDRYDAIFVHDPQPAPLARLSPGRAKWIWRCHIDTSDPAPDVWAFLRGQLEGYSAAVFTLREFVPPDAPFSRLEIIPPAIDPLSPKNLSLGEDLARSVLDWIGVSLNRPMIAQISRFDPWKDPMGVIEAYRRARTRVPGLQLALIGSMALDDPEGWEVYRRIEEAGEADPLIHVFTNLTGVGNVEVNAFQSLARVVIQKSIREGFGLVVSEALWKGTPVVAGRTGGIPLQLGDDAGGRLVEGVDDCAEAIVDLLLHPDEAGRLGRAGRERVRERFLLPRMLLEELRLMKSVLG